MQVKFLERLQMRAILVGDEPMRHTKRSMLPTTLVMPALLYLPFHHVVDAYIDPGTGSLVIQALIGALAAGVVAIGVFWKQIKAFVKGLFSTSRSSGRSGEEPKE